jgi:aspartyl-tRNA(Asn)/glutamyl-tRNA(Gln) amidotransferase subunit B
MTFTPVICFETHIELATQSKLFCACSVDTASTPNSNICPICTGQPGSLPRLNEEAVRLAVLAGKALSCTIRSELHFARKNYFYPDLPKGFQISQHREPLCENGHLEIEGDDGEPYRVGIKRVHLEEDAGKLIHSEESDDELGYCLIDYNRASVPLIEIVMDHEQSPLRSVSEARRYLEKLRHLIQYIGVSHCLIEKGQFRSDVNVSLKDGESGSFNPRVEIKNMTSIKFIGYALTFEIARQTKVFQLGEQLTQETRLYDERTHSTVAMRKKEDAPDYRYFPEPDLPMVKWQSLIKKEAVEHQTLPDEQAQGIAVKFSIPEKDAQLLTRDRKLTEFFLKSVELATDKRLLARWITQELFSLQNERGDEVVEQVKPGYFARLVDLVGQKKITAAMGRKILRQIAKTGEDPEIVAGAQGMVPMRDRQKIESLIEKIMADNPALRHQLTHIEAKAVSFLIGQVLKESEGMADPEFIRRSIIDIFGLASKSE